MGLDLKTIGLYLFKFIRFIIKKALTIILWIFLIITLIVLIALDKTWAAAGVGALVAFFYVIKYFRMKIKEGPSTSEGSRTRKSSSWFNPPADR
ncbi:hypothetical protein WEN_02835 [Mycoplasma wenyonii str. Massachusetts]|uniref:Uncharacterized protein n=1 Tax=Mycoplasma wenyonii (strain Massachusetts) TaxID=1197325 RepID=I6ZJH8_MYCWM|nr:hypothetical protein [Mycoplasma wenyonii]AFN65350.1 hypothetical protein WEN_02835 [Mycoplasma wenyonii str. Massachusetts]